MDKQEFINDEDDLYRRIPPLWYVEKEDRISSAAFKDPKTSVNWAKYATPEETIVDHPNFHVGTLQVKIPRSERAGNQEVKHDPKIDNYSHSLIIGKKTQSVARFLARHCRFVIKRA